MRRLKTYLFVAGAVTLAFLLCPLAAEAQTQNIQRGNGGGGGGGSQTPWTSTINGAGHDITGVGAASITTVNATNVNAVGVNGASGTFNALTSATPGVLGGIGANGFSIMEFGSDPNGVYGGSSLRLWWNPSDEAVSVIDNFGIQYGFKGPFTGDASGLTNLLLSSLAKSGATDGQIAVWSAAAGQWVPTNMPSGGGGASTNVHTLTCASVVWVDGSLANRFVMAANQNFTLAFTNATSELEHVEIRVDQDATGNRVMTLDTNTVAFGRSLTGATLSTNANYSDHLGWEYNGHLGKWDMVGTPDGYR